MKKLLLLCFALIVMQMTFGQLTGTKTIPGDYATIAAAVTDLNTQGVGSGGVTFNVASGHTETIAAVISLTATGTAANQIIFQKNGGGANPLITANTGTNTPASAVQDGIWNLVGSDYVTINGIDLYDPNTTNPATMEYGYAMFKAAVDNGCQYNTIKNCVMTLSRENNVTGSGPSLEGSKAINVVNATVAAQTTAVTPTVAEGTNSYNMFYGNTLQNCNYGIVISGYAAATPFTLGDTGNDIGGTSAPTGNMILNFGGATGATNPAAGIRVTNVWGTNISYNTLNNNNGSGVNHAAIIRGIYAQAGTSANVTINNNSVTIIGGGTTTQISCIENGIGATAAGNTVSINNNTITNCTNATNTTGLWYGIWNNAASATNLNIQNNTFSNNATNATSGSSYLIYNSGACPGIINITNNQLSQSFPGATAYSGTLYNIYNGSGTTATTLNITGNNFANYNFTTIGTGAIYFIYNTNGCANNTISSNTWTNLTLNHSGTEYLIYNSTSTQVALNVNNNSIVTGYTRTAAAGTMYIYYSGASSLGTSTQTFSGNNFSNITATTAGSGTFYMFYNSDGASSPYPKKALFNNTFSNINYNTTGTIYGMYTSYLGDGSAGSGTNIYNNTFSNITVSGSFYCMYPATTVSPTYQPNVYGNNINNLTTNGAASVLYACYLGGGGAGLNFYKNKIYSITANGATGSAHGIYVTSAITTNIFNNLVSDIRAPFSSLTAPAPSATGMYFGGGTTINASYNTIFLNSTSTGANFGTAAVYASSTPTVTLRNNVFVNTSTPNGTGRAIAYQRSSTTLTTYGATSNNNDFFAGTPGTNNLIYYDGTNSQQTLDAYKLFVMPRDAFAVSENPSFLSTAGSNPNFLHINAAIATQLESGASNVTGITDDYDGEIRQGNTGYSGTGTAPDIGADEFAGIPLDITPPTIIYTPLVNTSIPGVRLLTTSIFDANNVPTAGIGLPVLYWKINSGSYNPVTAVYVSGSTYTFTFGAGTVMGDVVSYYVVAQDIATTPNAGSYPSTGASGFTINPPAAAVPPTPPSTYTISVPLSGSYTVGLAMFNSLTGKNISFERSVTRVMKEIDVEVPSKSGETADATETPVRPNSVKQLMEVEEVSWIPMENGKPYTGELFVSDVQIPGSEGRETMAGVYATITAAIADLNLRGVSGPVTFVLTDATYPTETFPLIVNVYNINKPTSTNTVTVKPSTGVTTTITGASAAAQIFRILESHFIIDGSNSGGTDRSMTIENTSTTTPSVILVGSTGTTPITNVTIKNCNLINGVNSSSAVVISDGATSGTAGYYTNITLRNNTVQKAYIGVYCNAVIAAGNGNGLLLTENSISTSGANSIRLVALYLQGVDGATVSNNTIGNIVNTTDASNLSGIWCATGTVNSSISGNTISTISGTSTGPRGIAISSAIANSNLNITGNTLSGLTTTSSIVSYGIYYFSTTSGCTIQKNMISDVKNSNSGGWSAIGIALASTLTASNTTVQNNVIYDVAGYGYSSMTTDNGYGINILSGGGYNLYFNTVRLSTNQTSATGNPACLIISSAVTTASLDIRDNIFYIDATFGTNRFAVLCNATNAVFNAINYNNYFSAGPNLGYLGANILDLAAWKIATGKDINSQSINPSFVSLTDQHPTNVALDNLGFYLTAITTDYAGVSRTNPPDIGAYEFGVNPTVVTLAASDLNCGGGTLNGTINANGLTVNSFFDYGPTITYGTSVAGTPATVTGTTPTAISTVIAMPPSTTWHFRTRGVTSAGVTVYGNDLTVTSADPAGPAATTQVATNITDNSATLNGSVNAFCNSTTVTFEYGLTTSYGFTVTADQSPVSGSGATAVSNNITGLAINTLYHFRVVASNAGGTVYGADLNFTTGAIPPTVTTNAATNIGNFAARLNGTVTANNQNSTVTFQWGLTTSYGNTVAGIPGTVTGTMPTAVYADISSLNYNTIYHFRCVAQNPAGTTYGADQVFTTLCPIPGAAGTITGPTSLCQATSGHVYTVPPITYAYNGYVWTLPAGGTITAGAGTNSITVSYSSSAVSGNVTVYGTSVCGNGTPSSLAVTVNPLPVPVVIGPNVACITHTYTYSTADGMSGYVWTVSAGGQIMSGGGTDSITVKWNSAGSQYLTLTYISQFGCPAATPTTYNVTVGNLTSPTIAGSNMLCLNTGLHVYTTETGYSNYVWAVTSGGTIVSGQGTYQIEVNWTTAGSKTVSVNYANTYGCSANAPSTFAVTVMAYPGTPDDITGPSALCAGTMGVSYSVDPIPNAVTYNWTVPAGVTIVSGATTNSIVVDFALDAETGDFIVAGENICGIGPSSPPYEVRVDPIPETPVVTIDESYLLQSSAPSGNQWYYEGAEIPGAVDQDYQATEEGYYWTIVTLNGCVSDESNHEQVIFVGLNDPEAGNFTIYPIPNDGKFTVTVVVTGEETFSINVYNNLGMNVYEKKDFYVSGKAQQIIDLVNPSKGIYTVVFRGENHSVIRKVVVTE